MNETLTSPTKTLSWKMLLVGLGVFLLLLISFVWYQHSRKYVWTNDAYLDGYQISISADIEARIHAVRPVPGQAASAANLWRLLDGSGINQSHEACGKVQDAYALRCAPQVHGAAREALTVAKFQPKPDTHVRFGSSYRIPFVFRIAGAAKVQESGRRARKLRPTLHAAQQAVDKLRNAG